MFSKFFLCKVFVSQCFQFQETKKSLKSRLWSGGRHGRHGLSLHAIYAIHHQQGHPEAGDLTAIPKQAAKGSE